LSKPPYGLTDLENSSLHSLSQFLPDWNVLFGSYDLYRNILQIKAQFVYSLPSRKCVDKPFLNSFRQVAASKSLPPVCYTGCLSGLLFDWHEVVTRPLFRCSPILSGGSISHICCFDRNQEVVRGTFKNILVCRKQFCTSCPRSPTSPRP